MLDIDLIENTIRQLEQDATTLDNCILLSSLYICRENYYNANMSVLEASNDASYRVYTVLPSYDNYIETKKRYQQYEVVDKMLIYAMDNLCREIVDFISNLYHNTETEAERALLIKMINEDLRSAI